MITSDGASSQMFYMSVLTWQSDWLQELFKCPQVSDSVRKCVYRLDSMLIAVCKLMAEQRKTIRFKRFLYDENSFDAVE